MKVLPKKILATKMLTAKMSTTESLSFFPFLFLGGLVSAMLTTGCGVRGRPQPPLTPPELGRGQPTYTRGTENEFAFPNVPPVSDGEEGTAPPSDDGSEDGRDKSQ